MTYDEIKVKLSKCERSLQALKNGTHANIPPQTVPRAIERLEVMKEQLENKLLVLEAEKTAFVNKTNAIEYDDESELRDLKNNADVDSIVTAKGKRIKELLDLDESLFEGINYSMEETKSVAKQTGKATLKALKSMGEDIKTSKAQKIYPGKFEIFVEFKNGKTQNYEFSIDDSDKLYLNNEVFNKFVGEVGVQPSGEVIVHEDVLAGNIKRAIQANLSPLNKEEVNDKDTKDLKKLSKALKGSSQAHLDQKKKLDKLINTEGEGDDHHYLKVSRRDYKKAMSILDRNVDPTYVKMEVVDNDGAGSVIIYFIFRDEYGFDDMYDDPEGKENPELYQEPDEDPHAFMYDVVMDLQAHGIDVQEHSAELDENVTQKHIDDIEASGNIDIAYKKAMELLKSMIAKNETVEEGINESTDLYDRNGIQITRFAGGKDRGLMVQINYGGKYIHVPADEFAILARAMQSVIGDIRDMTLQMPRKNYPKNEALDSDLPKGKHSIAKLQKVHGMIVDKMKELAKLYKKEGPDHEYNGHPVIDHLKSLTSKKKKVEAALDKAVSNKDKGQELDPNINEVTEDQVQDAIQELRDLIDEIESKGEEAREVVRQVFPNELSRLDAYGAFNNMYSGNRYDVTLGGFVDRLEEEGYEIEDGEVYTNEAGPGFKHDCAAKVVHEKYGAGTCIPEKHTLVKEGNKYVVTHYDVLFESGETVEDIPVSELEIKTQNEHWHKGYKKKKK